MLSEKAFLAPPWGDVSIQKMLRIWSPRSLWGYLYKCSPQRTVVGVPPKKCQIIFYWIPVGKPSFDQRVRLA